MAIDLARLGATYATLMAAHDLGDHIVQTDHQAATKATSWRGMAGHVGSYTALQVAALAALRAAGARPSWRRTLAAVAWSAATHAVLDERTLVKWILRVTRSPGFARGEMVIPELLVAVETPDQAVQRRRSAGTWGVLLHGHTSAQRVAAPLHGPYLADQALHHGVLVIAAAILAGGADPTDGHLR